MVILLYDQLLFRPLVAWADKFRFEQTASRQRADLLDAATCCAAPALLRALSLPFAAPEQGDLAACSIAVPQPWQLAAKRPARRRASSTGSGSALIVAGIGYAAWRDLSISLGRRSSSSRRARRVRLGLITLVRVVVLIALASLIWVPIGVWIGLRPVWAERVQPVAQFLAAFPANLLFPVVRGGASSRFGLDRRTSGYAADDPGHPVVHPVQRHRRRHRLPERPEGGGEQLSASAAGGGGAR